MGRPKGSANKPKGAAGRPAPTAQQMDDDHKRVLFNQHRDAYKLALEAKKTADARLKNACKIAKSELGKQAVAQIKISIELMTPEGEAAVRERLAAMAEVARWAGAKLGAQFDMFKPTPETPVDRAYEEGKISGIEGEVAKPPYAPATEQYEAWLSGHGDGQAAKLSAGIKPLDAPHSSVPIESAEADGALSRPEWKEHLQSEIAEGDKLTRIGSAPPTAQVTTVSH